jgi:hypothetical protein
MASMITAGQWFGVPALTGQHFAKTPCRTLAESLEGCSRQLIGTLLNNPKLRIGMAGLGVAISAWVLAAYLGRPQTSFAQAVHFVRELHASSVALEQRGQLPPASTQVSDLVRSGFISAESARGFQGATVTFSRTIDESRPQEALVRLQLRDGRTIVMLGDGSVQQIAR